jgi:hypothetical protein
MLVTSIMSVVRELDARYAFVEDIAIPDEISLNRGGFDVFGDVLFVLIGNAAKHGQQDGEVRVSARMLEGGNGVIGMEVTSECKDEHEYLNAVARIRAAISVAEPLAIDAAAVGEGFSGLRKLIGLLGRIRFADAKLLFRPSRESLRISFWLAVPAEIMLVRTRG